MPRHPRFEPITAPAHAIITTEHNPGREIAALPAGDTDSVPANAASPGALPANTRSGNTVPTNTTPGNTVSTTRGQYRWHIGASRADIRRIYGLEILAAEPDADLNATRARINAALPYIRRGDDKGLAEHVEKTMPASATAISRTWLPAINTAGAIGVTASGFGILSTSTQLLNINPFDDSSSITMIAMIIATFAILAIQLIKIRGREQAIEAYVDDTTAVLHTLSENATIIDACDVPALKHAEQMLVHLECALEEDPVSVDAETIAAVATLWQDYQELVTTITALDPAADQAQRQREHGAVDMVATALHHRGATLYQQVRSQQEILTDAAAKIAGVQQSVTAAVAQDKLAELTQHASIELGADITSAASAGTEPTTETETEAQHH